MADTGSPWREPELRVHVLLEGFAHQAPASKGQMPAAGGSAMNAKGCFTQEKFVAGRNLREIETILGFAEHRLRNGGIVVALTQLPCRGQFRCAGYTNVSLHNFEMPTGLDPRVLERNAMEQWQLTGLNRLVKVIPNIGHDPGLNPDDQYPHAKGAPQWEVQVELPCIVAGVLSNYPEGTYRPNP